MKALEKSVIVGMIFTFLYKIVSFGVCCESINSKVFRLHILANSNSEADQNLKLCIRDKIQLFAKNALGSTSSKEEAKRIFAENICNIEKIALDEVNNYGYDYNVSAELTNTYFTTRDYESFTMPAGNYDALKLKIGSGKGKNWWCVIFPMLCVGAATKKENLKAVLSKREARVISKENARYEIKFKIIEIYQSVKKWFKEIFGRWKRVF